MAVVAVKEDAMSKPLVTDELWELAIEKGIFVRGSKSYTVPNTG